MSTESVSAPVALVTGADKGIGLETARRLAGAGYRVYHPARSSRRGRAAGARFLELDVTSDKSVYHAAGCVDQAGEHLDVLVNNAGTTGPVRDDPRIVNVSSGLGSFVRFHDRNRIGVFVGTSVYAASKAAINMMTVQFASLLPNIRINAADPGGPSDTFADRDGEEPW